MHLSQQGDFNMYGCKTCSSGTFNLFGGFVSGRLAPQHNCTPCPVHSSCTTNTSVSTAGYALYQPKSQRRIEQELEWLSVACPNQEACPPRDIDPRVSNEACKDGYTNPELGCGLCDYNGDRRFSADDYDPFICARCPEGEMVWSALFALSINSIPAILAVKACSSVGTHLYSRRKQDRSFAPLLKILVSFTAILPSLAGIDWGRKWFQMLFEYIGLNGVADQDASAPSVTSRASCIFRQYHQNSTTLQLWAYLQVFSLVTACALYSFAFGIGCAQWQLVAVPPSISHNMRWWNVAKRNIRIVTVVCVYQLIPRSFGTLFLLLPCVSLGTSERRFMYQLTKTCGWDSSVITFFVLVTILGFAMVYLCYSMFRTRKILRRVLESHAAPIAVIQTPLPSHPPIRAPQWETVGLVREECGAQMAERASIIVKVIEQHSKGRCAPNEIRKTITLADPFLADMESSHADDFLCEESRSFLDILVDADATFQTLENPDTEQYNAITDTRHARTLYEYSYWGFLCDGYTPDAWYWEA